MRFARARRRGVPHGHLRRARYTARRASTVDEDGRVAYSGVELSRDADVNAEPVRSSTRAALAAHVVLARQTNQTIFRINAQPWRVIIETVLPYDTARYSTPGCEKVPTENPLSRSETIGSRLTATFQFQSGQEFPLRNRPESTSCERSAYAAAGRRDDGGRRKTSGSSVARQSATNRRRREHSKSTAAVPPRSPESSRDDRCSSHHSRDRRFATDARERCARVPRRRRALWGATICAPRFPRSLVHVAGPALTPPRPSSAPSRSDSPL